MNEHRGSVAEAVNEFVELLQSGEAHTFILAAAVDAGSEKGLTCKIAVRIGDAFVMDHLMQSIERGLQQEAIRFSSEEASDES